MINLDFSLGLGLYLLFFIGCILTLWSLGWKAKNKDFSLDPKFIWFCSVCTHTYVNTKQEAISICPRCGSYNKK